MIRNIPRDFQICISAPLNSLTNIEKNSFLVTFKSRQILDNEKIRELLRASFCWSELFSYIMATSKTFEILMYQFRVHSSTIAQFIPSVCQTIYSNLKDIYLKFHPQKQNGKG